MPRSYKLVRHGYRWQVCSRARRIVNGREQVVWIYGDDRLPFCLEMEADRVMALPPLEAHEPTNFFSDRFTYVIDEIDAEGNLQRKLAGSCNLITARVCFEEFVLQMSASTMLQLRYGGFIMARRSGAATGSQAHIPDRKI